MVTSEARLLSLYVVDSSILIIESHMGSLSGNVRVCGSIWNGIFRFPSLPL